MDDVKILAIDTALAACSVALLEGDRVVAARREIIGRGHAERLMPMLTEVVRAASVPYAALDRIAVSRGPGSFTGLRAGLAAARGLALAVDKPLVGVTTLEALAAGVQSDGQPILVAIDARRGELYAQAFDASFVPLSEPGALTADAAAGLLPNGGWIVGSGAQLVQSAAPGRFLAAAADPDPDAILVARLAQSRPASQAAIMPLYLRAPDATLPLS